MEAAHSSQEPKEVGEGKGFRMGIVDEVPKCTDDKDTASKMGAKLSSVDWRFKELHGPEDAKVRLRFHSHLMRIHRCHGGTAFAVDLFVGWINFDL